MSFCALAQGTKYEAEDGVLTGSVTKLTSLSGYSGSGYVGNFVNDNDQVAISITLPQAGNYKLYIGYASPSGEKLNTLIINGNKADITFPNVGSFFKEYAFGTVRLRSGTNLISIIKSWGWICIDYIRIEENYDPEIKFVVPNQLVTPSASAEAKSLYKFLLDNYGKHIISGVMNLDRQEEAEWLKTNTGKYPALIGLDFMNHTRNYSWYNKTNIITDCINYYHRNGIAAVCWHWRDPLWITDEFYTNKTTFDVSKVTDTSSSEYKKIIVDIDTVARYMKQLQDSGVPVIFRPLHEASGGWFWWGAKGAAPCKALYNILFDRLVNYHGINNLIWVWTTDSKSTALDWYPGNDYVDILGMDIYPSNGDYSSHVLDFNKVRDLFNGKKMITLSENGVLPDPDNLTADEAQWSYFMPWYGDYVRKESINPLSQWIKILNHQYVITLDEMPDLKNYPSDGAGLTSVIQAKSSETKYWVYYNQNGNSLYVSPNNFKSKFSISLIDMNGKLRFTQSNLSEGNAISLPYLTTGIYIVRIVSPGGVASQKIVIAH